MKYSKQCNYCVSLVRKTKRTYYGNLNEKEVTDNRKFLKTVKPFLSDKCPSNEKVILVEEDEIISKDSEMTEVLNTLSSNIVNNLNIPEYQTNAPISDNLNGPVLKAIAKYKNHPSIKAIEKIPKPDNLFNFSNVDKEEVFKEIIRLDASKASQDTDVPTKVIKENADIFSHFLYPSVNACINNDDFPTFLKHANIIPAFKKGSKNIKDNYRPISILKNISKVYERIMFKQIGEYMDPFFSKFLCGFRKGFSTQQCLIAFIEKWKSAVYKGKYFGALLTDLSKAFDCLPHELLIAKLHACGFSLSALRLMYSYLSNRKQRTKINESYSSWEEILYGVPQGSILGPLLFNIFMCDLFLIVNDIDFANYADDNTPFVFGNNPIEVLKCLEDASDKLSEWFSNNQMKANPGKCQPYASSRTPTSINIKGYVINNSLCEKLLGVTIDSKLSFNAHLDKILISFRGVLSMSSGHNFVEWVVHIWT